MGCVIYRTGFVALLCSVSWLLTPSCGNESEFSGSNRVSDPPPKVEPPPEEPAPQKESAPLKTAPPEEPPPPPPPEEPPPSPPPEEPPPPPPPEESPPPPPEEEPVEESVNLLNLEFSVEEDSIIKDVNIAWIVDQSGSMSDEAAEVERQLQGFEAKIAAFANVKGYLSTKNAWDVGSTDGPACFLSALGIPPQENSTCGEDVIVNNTLANFYTEGARNIAIFVSDDDSELPSATIKTQLNQFGHDDLIVFGFIGLNEIECPSLSDIGTVYKQLAEVTGGQVFNLCAADWTPHYEKLLENIEQSVITEIATQLPPDTKIVRVRLNGELVDETNYTFEEGIIKFAEGILSKDDFLLVVYEEPFHRSL